MFLRQFYDFSKKSQLILEDLKIWTFLQKLKIARVFWKVIQYVVRALSSYSFTLYQKSWLSNYDGQERNLSFLKSPKQISPDFSYSSKQKSPTFISKFCSKIWNLRKIDVIWWLLMDFLTIFKWVELVFNVWFCCSRKQQIRCHRPCIPHLFGKSKLSSYPLYSWSFWVYLLMYQCTN